jgi:hypothetical protein
MATATGNISISTVVSADGIVECRGRGPCLISAQGAFGPVSVTWTYGGTSATIPVKDTATTATWSTATDVILGFPSGLDRVVRATIGSATAATSIRIGIAFGDGAIGV